MKYDSSNEGSDKSALLSVQEQINAQLALNGAILAGKDARDAANLATEQTAIRKGFDDRGDTDKAALQAALDANKELFDLKVKQADLNKASSMNPAQQYDDEAKAIQRAADAARDAGHAIADMQIQAANKANWQAYLESIDRVKLEVGSLSDGVSVFFNQMANNSTSAAQQMHDVLEQTFNSLNDMFARFVEGQKVNFGEFFKGIAGSLAKLSAQKAEQALAGAVFGKAANPQAAMQAVTNGLITTTNTLLSAVVANTAASAGGSALGMLDSGSADDSSSSSGSKAGSVATGIVSTLLGALIPGFGGHRALGGDVVPGMSYDVGEMGRETFTPTVNGKITPNNKTMGTVINMPIDARGSNDPAQVNAAIHRAMTAYYGSAIASGAVRNMREDKLRSPLSKRS